MADEPTPHTPLLDVTGTSMLDLLHNGDPGLARCIRRLVDAIHDPDGVISAFQNFATTGGSETT